MTGSNDGRRILQSVALYSAEPAKGWLTWGLLAPFLCIVFVAACQLGLDPLMLHFQWIDAKGDPIGLTGFLAFLTIPFALTGLVFIAWVLLVERRPLATIGLGGRGKTRSFVRGHLIGIATIGGIVATISLSGGYEAAGYGAALASPGALLNIGLLLAAFALQSSVEEIIFRGWLLSVVARKFNVPIAIALTSIVFAFLHFSPQQPWLVTLSSVLFSVFACFWALRAGNIWSVMGWHAGWNWLLATGFELPVTGFETGTPALLVKLVPRGSDFLTGGAEGPEGSVLCVLFFAGATVLLLLRGRARSAA